MNQMEIYEFLAQQDGCLTVGEIAERFGTSDQVVSNKLHKLERYNMVEKIRCKYGVLWRAVQ